MEILGEALKLLQDLTHETEYQLKSNFPSPWRLQEEHDKAAEFLKSLGVDA